MKTQDKLREEFNGLCNAICVTFSDVQCSSHPDDEKAHQKARDDLFEWMIEKLKNNNKTK